MTARATVMLAETQQEGVRIRGVNAMTDEEGIPKRVMAIPGVIMKIRMH